MSRRSTSIVVVIIIIINIVATSLAFFRVSRKSKCQPGNFWVSIFQPVPLLEIVMLAMVVRGICVLFPAGHMFGIVNFNPPLVGTRTRHANKVPVNTMMPCGNRPSFLRLQNCESRKDVLAGIQTEFVGSQVFERGAAPLLEARNQNEFSRLGNAKIDKEVVGLDIVHPLFPVGRMLPSTHKQRTIPGAANEIAGRLGGCPVSKRSMGVSLEDVVVRKVGLHKGKPPIGSVQLFRSAASGENVPLFFRPPQVGLFCIRFGGSVIHHVVPVQCTVEPFKLLSFVLSRRRATTTCRRVVCVCFARVVVA
mmetsp:Transcript_27465/g.51550  ORF Transcript_27465/g.51550 Transcript_27465/m.51550 type:complete len:307 (+) Transcript_27465:484-1404(+)